MPVRSAPRRPPPWGFHRLAEDAAERLVAASGAGRGDLVIDVGAGDGVITDALLRRDARVIAVERHPQRLADLRARYADDRRVIVIGADAADLKLPRRPFHVVANPPFAITTALLTRLLHPSSRLISATLVLQEQAARRWASPSAPGAARWQRHIDARVGTVVPRRCFDPPPPVEARVLLLRRRPHRERSGQ